MKQVLLPFDFSLYSQRALALALRGYPFGTDAALTLVHVLDEPLYARVLPTRPLPSRERIESYLAAEVERAKPADDASTLSTRLEVVHGNVLEELTTRARSTAFDAVMLGGQGHGGAAEMLLGTTARRLVRQTTIPAYVVKRIAADTMPRRALCAVDIDDIEQTKAALICGRDLARRFDMELDTLTVVSTEAWPYTTYFPANFGDGIEKHWQDEATRACAGTAVKLRALEQTLLGALVSKEQRADYGPTGWTIVRQGRAYDTIILGALQHSRITPFGSTIEAVLERANADVLIAR